MTNIIEIDPLENIIYHLIPKDLYSLKLTSKLSFIKINKKIINKSIINIINNKLFEIFGDKLGEFKDILRETKAVISGSFIIQCILNEFWDKSDIDIYMPFIDNKYYDANKVILSIYYERPIVDRFTILENFLYDNGNYINYNDYDFLLNNKKIYGTRDYSINNINIEIIHININKKKFKYTKKFIMDTFDLDICKNLYFINNEDNIDIYKLNDIFNKTCDFNHCPNGFNIFNRFNKYIERGFVINNNVSYLILADKLYDDYNNRTHYIFEVKEYNDCEYEVISGGVEIIRKYCSYLYIQKNLVKLEKYDYYTKINWNCDKNCLINFCNCDDVHIHVKLISSEIELIFIIK
jgi:hypothetical protein